MDKSFLIKAEEINLSYRYAAPKMQLKYKGDDNTWRRDVKAKLLELVGINNLKRNKEVTINCIREEYIEKGILIKALVMKVSDELEIPAYLMCPDEKTDLPPVMALQGHGQVAGILGLHDDYHHSFGLELCRMGRIVIAVELRGFCALVDLAKHLPGYKLDYADWDVTMQYSMVTDAIQKGTTLIGETLQDIFDYSNFILNETQYSSYDVVGVSYGGDLALYLASLDERVRKIFVSGTMGSYNGIFDRCYNMGAHLIPNILQYMDRADIAGTIAPRDLLVHYGLKDVPSDTNTSAAYNETALVEFERLQAIYTDAHAGDNVTLHVSPHLGHEIDIDVLKKFII